MKLVTMDNGKLTMKNGKWKTEKDQRNSINQSVNQSFSHSLIHSFTHFINETG